MENIQQSENHEIVNNEVKTYLLETSKWGKFLAIVGYVGMGLLVLAGLLFMVSFSQLQNLSNSSVPTGFLGFAYIVMAVIYFFPINYLYKFSTRMKQGLLANNEMSVTSAFQNLKSLFKFTGILTIVIISLYVLILVGAIIAISITGSFM